MLTWFQIVKKSQAGAGVAVKIEHAVYQSAKMFGRHFDEKDEIVSHITRQSIDVLKASAFTATFVTATHMCTGYVQGRRLERGVAPHQGSEAGTIDALC
jgi:hypothetical protein